MKYSFSLICLLFLLAACGGESKQECETLTPVFKKELPGITNYKYEKGKQKAYESFFVHIDPVSMDIELFQSGCQLDDMSQEIRMNLHPIDGEALEPVNALECAEMVSHIFGKLSALESVSLAGFYTWGEAIAKNRTKFQYNEPTFVDDAQQLSVQLDKAKRGNYVQITVLIK